MSENKDAEGKSEQQTQSETISTDEGQATNTFSSDGPSELEKALTAAAKFKNDYLYLRAEFDNYKKHAIKERSEMLRYGSERLAHDLLGVLDNFERALTVKMVPENFSIFAKGIEMTATELRNTLQKHGISEVPAEGLPFDPNIHEALSAEPTDKYPDGSVCRVFQKAYKFYEKILRPAQVVVAKKPDVN